LNFFLCLITRWASRRKRRGGKREEEEEYDVVSPPLSSPLSFF